MGRALQIICGIVLAFGLSGAAQQAELPRQSSGTDDSPNSAESVPATQAELAAIARALERIASQPPEPDEERRAVDDLKAQQRMAGWAIWMGILTGAQVLVGIVGVIAVLNTLKQGREALDRAQDANDLARASAERQLRAYITIDKVYATDVAPGKKPEFHFSYINTGQTPATITSICRVAAFIPAPCDEARISFPRKKRSSVAMGGGQQNRQTSTIPKALDQTLFDHFIAGRMNFVFAGVITYRDIFGVTRRTTFRAHAPNHGMNDGKLPLEIAEKHSRST